MMGGKNMITSPSVCINTPDTSYSFCKAPETDLSFSGPSCFVFQGLFLFQYLAYFLPFNSGLFIGIYLL